MYENEFRVIILLIGILIIFYILFISKDKRKYKVYKTNEKYTTNKYSKQTNTGDRERKERKQTNTANK